MREKSVRITTDGGGEHSGVKAFCGRHFPEPARLHLRAEEG